MMKISLQEVERIRNAGPLVFGSSADEALEEAPNLTVAEGAQTRAEEVQAVREALQQSPDVREELVQALKARIESGTYHVAGEEIADLMVRRAYADSIR